MRRLIALALALVALAGCVQHPPGATEKERFDNWIVSQGVQIVHAPVPCQQVPYLRCDGLGGYWIEGKTVFINDGLVAQEQARQPDKDVALHVLYHELSHAAFFITASHLNPNPGDIVAALIWYEREAQCGMRLLVGGMTFTLGDPNIYWICPDAKVEETRQLWFSKGVI